MCHSSLRAAALALCLLLAPSISLASDDRWIGIGGHVVTSFTSASDSSAVIAYGLQLRVRPFRKLALEGSVSSRKENFDDGGLYARAYPVQASLLWYILTGRFDAYLLAGVSYLFVDAEDTLSGDSSLEAIPGKHVGGGVQLKLLGPWHLHADARYLVASDTFRGMDLDYDGALLNAGLSYWW